MYLDRLKLNFQLWWPRALKKDTYNENGVQILNQIRLHCDGNKRKKRMKRANWDYCIHQCQANSSNSNQLENSNQKTISNHQEAITRAYHHRTMIMSWANVFTSVAVNLVNKLGPISIWRVVLHLRILSIQFFNVKICKLSTGGRAMKFQMSIWFSCLFQKMWNPIIKGFDQIALEALIRPNESTMKVPVSSTFHAFWPWIILKFNLRRILANKCETQNAFHVFEIYNFNCHCESIICNDSRLYR